MFVDLHKGTILDNNEIIQHELNRVGIEPFVLPENFHCVGPIRTNIIGILYDLNHNPIGKMVRLLCSWQINIDREDWSVPIEADDGTSITEFHGKYHSFSHEDLTDILDKLQKRNLILWEEPITGTFNILNVT